MLLMIITFYAAILLLPSIGSLKLHNGTYYGKRRTYSAWLRSRRQRYLSR